MCSDKEFLNRNNNFFCVININALAGRSVLPTNSNNKLLSCATATRALTVTTNGQTIATHNNALRAQSAHYKTRAAASRLGGCSGAAERFAVAGTGFAGVGGVGGFAGEGDGGFAAAGVAVSECF